MGLSISSKLVDTVYANIIMSVTCRTDVFRYSFPSGIRSWNHIPESIATATSLDGFKGRAGHLLLDVQARFYHLLIIITLLSASQSPCIVYLVRRRSREGPALYWKRRRNKENVTYVYLFMYFEILDVCVSFQSNYIDFKI